MKRYIRGLTFCILWYLSVLAGFFALICPILPLAIISPKKYRKWSDRIFGMWESFPVALMEICLGVRVVLTGDRINPSEGSLFIMNHRTRVDWNFFFSGLFHCCHPTVAHNIKIILKAPLMHFPGAGWVMQTCSFIFLHRNWEKDKPLLNKILEYLDDSDNKYQILLFPEGTDLTESNLRKSHKYAEENNLQKYCNVLHPRTTGFAFLVNKMRSDGQLKAIYDVTVAYPKTRPLSELDLLRGKFPEEVHFHVKRHPSSSLPEEEEGLETWLKNIWKEKERKLEKFCMTKSFAGGEDAPVYSLSDQDIDFGKMTIKNGIISYEEQAAKKREKSICSETDENVEVVEGVPTAKEKSKGSVLDPVEEVLWSEKEKSQEIIVGSVGAVSAAKEKLQSLRESIEADIKAREKSQSVTGSIGGSSIFKEKLQSLKESFGSDSKAKGKSQVTIIESAVVVSEKEEKSQAALTESDEAIAAGKEKSLGNVEGSIGAVSAAKERSRSLLESIGVISAARGNSRSVLESIGASSTAKEKSRSVLEAIEEGSSGKEKSRSLLEAVEAGPSAKEKPQGSVIESAEGRKSFSLRPASITSTDEKFKDYRPSQLLYVVLGFWLTLITVMLYLLTCHCFLQIWVLTHSVLFIILSVVSNGFHLVAASYYLYKYKKRPCCRRKCD